MLYRRLYSQIGRNSGRDRLCMHISRSVNIVPGPPIENKETLISSREPTW